MQYTRSNLPAQFRTAKMKPISNPIVKPVAWADAIFLIKSDTLVPVKCHENIVSQYRITFMRTIRYTPTYILLRRHPPWTSTHTHTHSPTHIRASEPNHLLVHMLRASKTRHTAPHTMCRPAEREPARRRRRAKKHCQAMQDCNRVERRRPEGLRINFGEFVYLSPRSGCENKNEQK